MTLRIFLAIAMALLLASFNSYSLSRTPCRTWEIEHDQRCCPCHRSSRLILPPVDICQTFSLEIAHDRCGDRMYVNLLTFRVEGYECDVGIETDEEFVPYVAHVLEGGQRLLLPCEAMEQLFTALWEGREVHVHLGRRSAIIPCIGFIAHYEKLRSPPVCHFSLREVCSWFLPS